VDLGITVDDEKGVFTKHLRQLGCQNIYWRKRVKFHIDVITTEGDLEKSEFFLSAEQLKKVKPSALSNPWRFVGNRVPDEQATGSTLLPPECIYQFIRWCLERVNSCSRF
jgi:hypothetical protein